MPRAVAVLLACALVVVACKRDPVAPAPAKSSPEASSSVTKVPVSPPPEKPADALATITTNFSGVVADVSEFRRKGPVLTALVRLRNQGTSLSVLEISFDQTYVMDTGAKKYQVLKDEQGAFIASSASRLYEGLAAGGTRMLWMKFPAPPPEVRTATLVVPGMPPFEDLAIQDQ